MTIERAELRWVRLELRERFESSAGGRRERPVLLLSLESGDTVGWAECVALPEPYYSYETTETAWHILTEHLLPSVVGITFSSPSDVLRPAERIRGHPMARATVEMAAWDLSARLEGRSLADAVGGTRRSVEAGVSVGFQTDDGELFEKVGSWIEQGYGRIKVKIGPGRDVEMLRRVRSRFPDVALAADGNGSYSLADAARLRELDELNLTMLEQPLAWDDLRDHARLQAGIRTPICLDESIRSVNDLLLALDLDACRIVNVKPGRVGGLANAIAIHDVCRERGVPAWVGGMLESGIGRSHNVALASLPGFTLPGDLSESRRYWTRDLVTPEFELVDGRLAVPDGLGIGVAPDLERIEALTVRKAVIPS